jgi:hypothetical protein
MGEWAVQVWTEEVLDTTIRPALSIGTGDGDRKKRRRPTLAFAKDGPVRRPEKRAGLLWRIVRRKSQMDARQLSCLVSLRPLRLVPASKR